VLVGKGDEQNDVLTFDVAEPEDFWFHVSGHSGSHVVVRNPDKLPALPGSVLEKAAGLAAWYSKARGAGKVDVHWCRARDVSKPLRFPAGKVLLARWKRIRVHPRDPSMLADESE